MPHAIGTHHAALRLACGVDAEYPAPGSMALAGRSLVDLGSGSHPFPHVEHGASYLQPLRGRVTVDLPGGPRPEVHGMACQHHVEMDLNQIEIAAPKLGRRFDLVIALELIEHVENPWALVRGIGRLLATGGAAVISTPNITSPRAREFFRAEGTFPWFGTPDIHSQGHISPILPHMLEEMARRAGLRITDSASNEPPMSWTRHASQAEIDDVSQMINVYRLERA